MIANKVTAFHCEMVPFDVMAGGDCVISNSGSVTHLRKGFKMPDLSVMQSSLCFAAIESVTIPAADFCERFK